MDIKKIEIMENGELKQYDVLFTLKDEKKNKQYVIYTDVNSNIDIYAAIYDENNGKLDYIDNPEEQKLISEILNIVKSKIS